MRALWGCLSMYWLAALERRWLFLAISWSSELAEAHRLMVRNDKHGTETLDCDFLPQTVDAPLRIQAYVVFMTYSV